MPSVAKLEVLLAELASVTTTIRYGAYHATVVNAEPIAFAPEALDDRIDHDQVLDLWSCQLGLW